MVDYLYGKKESSKASSPKSEDDMKLQKYRQELKNYLHSQYYQREFNRPKSQERPAEKVEREKEQENFELTQKEKKKTPLIAVQRAQKVEKYPGAGG